MCICIRAITLLACEYIRSISTGNEVCAAMCCTCILTCSFGLVFHTIFGFSQIVIECFQVMNRVLESDVLIFKVGRSELSAAHAGLCSHLYLLPCDGGNQNMKAAEAGYMSVPSIVAHGAEVSSSRAPLFDGANR
jgi:hypothetical protein